MLHARVNRERKAARERSDSENLPACREPFSEWTQKRSAIGMQLLEQTERQHILNIEHRWTLVGAGIERILGRALSHGARIARYESAENRAGIVDGFRKCIAGLKSETGPGEVLLR